jgi:hypothetical protein
VPAGIIYAIFWRHSLALGGMLCWMVLGIDCVLWVWHRCFRKDLVLLLRVCFGKLWCNGRFWKVPF